MMKLVWVAVFLAAMVALSTAQRAGAATLTWILPTTTAGGATLAPDDISAVTVYRSSVVIVALPGTATHYDVVDCKQGEYTVTATAYTLESAHSNAVTAPVDATCAPKSPTGASF